MIHHDYSPFRVHERFLNFSFNEWCRVGGMESSLNGSRQGKGIFEANYPSINRRAEYLGYSSGSGLGCDPVRVRGCWPGVGIAWVGTGDACATVKPHSYTPTKARHRSRSARAWIPWETMDSLDVSPSSSGRHWLQPSRKSNMLGRAHDIR